MMDKLEVLFKEKVVWPSKILSSWLSDELPSVFVAVLKEKILITIQPMVKKFHNKGKRNMKEGDAWESFFSIF